MTDKKMFSKNREASCANCMYSTTAPTMGADGKVLIGETQLTCGRFPPQCFVITMQTPAGMVQGIQTQFPPVSDALICHEYKAEGSEDRAEALTVVPLLDSVQRA